MEYNIKTTYEIIDTKPSVLKTDIAIIDIVSFSMYYIGAPFYFIKRSLKTKERFTSLFKKRTKESFNGGEKNFAKFINLDNQEVKIDTLEVIKTDVEYYYEDNAYSKLNELISKNYKIDIERLSNNFLIKEKKEYFQKTSISEDKEEVLYSYPEFADKIAKLLHINKYN